MTPVYRVIRRGASVTFQFYGKLHLAQILSSSSSQVIGGQRVAFRWNRFAHVRPRTMDGDRGWDGCSGRRRRRRRGGGDL